MIEKNYANNYLPVIAGFLQGKTIPVKSSLPDAHEYTADNGILLASFKNDAYHISDYGRYCSPEKAPKNSVAILSIFGAITKYDQDCGPSGMKTKSDLMMRCYDNPNIKGIVLVIDSGGGEARACNLMMETISKRNKGVSAFVEDCACSAAYGIASACDTVTLNSEVAGVGSIGTLLTIADYTRYWEQKGINLIEIYASKSKDKNGEYYEALKGNVEPLRKFCDTYNDKFIASIADFRKGKISDDQSLWSTGKVFFAPEAIRLGLADNVGSLEDVINYFNV
ncbi:MAG: S49 family peptidase [Dysgonamonadaceae bacterium]|nr:S49 family peptidase [Dysgonamonadaceae bacterium]